MTTTTAATCLACGIPVEQPVVDGPLAALAANWAVYCDGCSDDRDQVARQARDAEDLRRRNALIGERLEQALPVALRKLNLQELDVDGRQLALRAADEFADGARLGLALTGAIGTGKTTIAAAAIRAGVERGTFRQAAWLSAPAAAIDLGRDFGDPARARVLAALTATSGALVLDDLDKVRPNQGAAEALFAAIDGCGVRRRPLAVTSNLMPSELAKRYPAPHGTAIASRIVGYCGEVHKISGQDRRAARSR
jgi:DNA replication protein DnaC